MTSLYMGFPKICFLDESNDICATVVRLGEAFPDIKIKHVIYDASSSFNVLDFCSMVLQRPGPVLLLQPIKSKVLANVRDRLAANVPVEAPLIASEVALHEAITGAIEHFTAGEPRTTLDIIVTLLILDKLAQNNMWGGKDKGYMWATDIAKGRGVDEKYAPRTPHVLNLLLQHDLLIKKPSQGKSKYALNGHFRTDINAILRGRKLPEELNRLLQRHPATESVRALDRLGDYEDPRP